MDLKIKDVAEMLNVSEGTIGEWLQAGKIPAYQIDEEYRFDRLEVEDWVMNHKLGETHGSSPFTQDTPNESGEKSPVAAGSQRYCLYRALHRGIVLYDVPGDTKEDVIRFVTERFAEQQDLDPQVLSELLLDREALMPTALANGVGVPHTREQVINPHQDFICVAFPQEPIEYGALDNQPVHSLFFLFASNDKRHLHLLAKLAHLASSEEGLEKLKTRPNKSEFLEFIRGWEAHIPTPV